MPPILALLWAAMPPASDLRSPTRQALRLVVRACALNDRLTGSPWPCREVVRSADPLGSFALLREPTGRRRQVLSPLAAVDGLEDGRLRLADAPNPFAAAWERRSEAGGPSDGRDIALAVNARYSRTQDHLHIHIACLRPEVRRILDRREASIPTGRFAALADPLGPNRYWARRYESGDPTRINPFTAVADGVPGAGAYMALHNIAVATARRGGVYVLASRTDRARFYETGAEHLLDATCEPSGAAG